MELACQADLRPDEKAKELLEELVRFCVDHGGPCFALWPAELVRQYLTVQAAAGNMVFVRTFGRVTGLGIVWRTEERHVREALVQSNHVWDHRRSAVEPGGGDCVYFSEFVANERGSLQRLLQEIWIRKREWRRLKWIAIRDGELVRMDGTRYERQFLTKGF